MFRRSCGGDMLEDRDLGRDRRLIETGDPVTVMVVRSLVFYSQSGYFCSCHGIKLQYSQQREDERVIS